MNSSSQRTAVLQDRFGHKTASCLSAAAQELPYDISERLRAARVQAVSQRKIAKNLAPAASPSGESADDRLGWWGRIGAVMPLIALVVGLLAIHSIQEDKRNEELAEVDLALLTDELPPAAFADPGFVQFLTTPGHTAIIQ
ncbi:MAG: DUF3619 family protein [Pseudomonadota bacterium]|nr:DUF3619 family protein [Pseudomonadota bacterium]